MPDTYDIPDVEIFATGKHHGIEFTDADVQRMVADTNAQVGREPFVGVGHDREPDAARVGTLANLRAVGGKILADFMNVPQKIVDAIKAGSLPKRSVELCRDFKDKEGSIFPWIIDAVALIGAGHPEVKDLANVDALFAGEGDGRIVVFTEADWPSEPKEIDVTDNIDAKVEEPTVDPVVEAEATEEEEDTTEMDALKEENEDLKGQIEALKSENGDIGDKVANLEEKDRNRTVDALMSELQGDGRVLQAEADMLRADLLDKLASPRMLMFGEKNEDAFEATAAQLRARKPQINFAEKSGESGVSEVPKSATTLEEFKARQAAAKNE